MVNSYYLTDAPHLEQRGERVKKIAQGVDAPSVQATNGLA